jgi:hypothetical protein
VALTVSRLLDEADAPASLRRSEGERQPGGTTRTRLRRTIPTLLVVLLGCAERRPANVALIVIDTLRADHLGCHG